MTRRIEIVTARPDWPEVYLALRPAILRAAPVGAYLHHIGSTAVPGLVAKDVIDVQDGGRPVGRGCRCFPARRLGGGPRPRRSLPAGARTRAA